MTFDNMNKMCPRFCAIKVICIMDSLFQIHVTKDTHFFNKDIKLQKPLTFITEIILL